MFWRKRKRKAELMRHQLRNGKTAWLYPGEVLIDITKAREGMEKQADIYVNGALIGRVNGEALSAIVLALEPQVFETEFGFESTGRTVRFQAASRAPEVIRTAIRIMDGEQNPGIKEAARVFEQAINSEPGVEVSIGSFDISTHGSPDRQRHTVMVTRASRKQVYP